MTDRPVHPRYLLITDTGLRLVDDPPPDAVEQAETLPDGRTIYCLDAWLVRAIDVESTSTNDDSLLNALITETVGAGRRYIYIAGSTSTIVTEDGRTMRRRLYAFNQVDFVKKRLRPKALRQNPAPR
jgi:hypothetical protein